MRALSLVHNTRNVPLYGGVAACDSRWNRLDVACSISDLRVL